MVGNTEHKGNLGGVSGVVLTPCACVVCVLASVAVSLLILHFLNN